MNRVFTYRQSGEQVYTNYTINQIRSQDNSKWCIYCPISRNMHPIITSPLVPLFKGGNKFVLSHISYYLSQFQNSASHTQYHIHPDNCIDPSPEKGSRSGTG